MKKIYYLLSLALILNTYSTLAYVLNVCHEDRDYYPLVGVDKEREIGLIQKSVIQAALNVGASVKFSSAPWKRCLSDLKAGKVDALMWAIWTPERDKHYMYPKNAKGLEDTNRCVYHAKYKVYVHKGSKLGWDGKSFTNVKNKISAPLGYVAFDDLKRLGVLAKNTHDPKRGLTLVNKRRLDGYVLEELIGDKLVKELELQNIEKIDIPFSINHEYIIFSKQLYYSGKRDLIEKFWDQFKSLKVN